MNVPGLVGPTLLGGTLVLATGWAGSVVWRRSAVRENAWWRTVLGLLLSVPLVVAGVRIVPAARWQQVPLVFKAEWFQPWRSVAVGGASEKVQGAGQKAASQAAPPSAVPAKTRAGTKGSLGGVLGAVWLAGVAVSVGRLAIGARAVRRLRRTARPGESAETVRTLADAARVAGVRVPAWRVAEVSTPMLIGWRRACILVPARGPSPSREVWLHELAHLRRADLPWMTLGRIVGALWWFHPLAWRVGRRLERSAEETCDDLVVRWTADAAGYAGQLAAFARTLTAGRQFAVAGVAITGFRSGLGQRVARLLAPGHTPRVAVGRGGAAGLAGGAALALGLVAIGCPRPMQGEAAAASGPTIAEVQIVAADGNPLPDETVRNIAGLEVGQNGGVERESEAKRRLNTSERFADVRVTGETSGEGKERVRITYTLKAVSKPEAANLTLAGTVEPAGTFAHSDEAKEPDLANMVAARVSGVEIPATQVRDLAGPRARSVRNGGSAGEELAEKLNAFWKDALHDLIDREIILQEFARKSFKIPADLIDDRVNTIVREEFNGDRDAFEKTLLAQGYTVEKFRQAEKDKVVVQAMRFQPELRPFKGTEQEWNRLSEAERKRFNAERGRAQEQYVKGLRDKATVQVLMPDSPEPEVMEARRRAAHDGYRGDVPEPMFDGYKGDFPPGE